MKFSNLLKILRDLGPAQVSLYGLYKLGLNTGYYKRVTSSPTLNTENWTLNTGHWTLPTRDSLSALLGPEGQQVRRRYAP